MNTNTSPKYLSSSNRYDYFLKTVAETGKLWILMDTTGNFVLFEVNNTTVFSLWPDEPSIQSNLTPDWADYIPFKIDINALEETVLPIIRQNDYLLNVFPVDSRTGHLVSLNDFVNDLNSTLQLPR